MRWLRHARWRSRLNHRGLAYPALPLVSRLSLVPTRFDLGDPAFDVTSAEVHAAREEDWYVETTWGWAVLRYAEVSALLRDRRFRQGNALSLIHI